MGFAQGCKPVGVSAPYQRKPRASAVRRRLSRFDDEVVPVLSTLRVGPIHNDGNDANVLVWDSGYESRARESLILGI